jgi:hypothetical protein
MLSQRDKENKYSESLWSLLCDCRTKDDEEIDSFSCFEKVVCFVFQTLGLKHQSLPLFIEVKCLLPTLEETAVFALIQIPFALQTFCLKETMSICTTRLILLCPD